MYAVNKKNKLDVIICDKLPKGYEEIPEEEYLKAVGSETEISDTGAKNFSYRGYSAAAQQTFIIDAKTGAANFASGAISIDALGSVTGLGVFARSNMATINPDAAIGIQAADQKSWIASLQKTALIFTNGNVYPATGRPTFNGSTGATIADLAKYAPIDKPAFNAPVIVADSVGIGATLWLNNKTANTGLLFAPNQGNDSVALIRMRGAASNLDIALQANTARPALGTNASFSISGTGDANGYGLAVYTPNGVYAPNGTSQLGNLSIQGTTYAATVITAVKGIAYPNIPNVATMYTMGFGWDGSRVRFLVDNNPAAAGAIPNMADVTAAKISTTAASYYAEHGSTRDWSYTAAIAAPGTKTFLYCNPSTYSGGGGGDQRSAFWINITNTNFTITGANTANTLGNGIQYAYISSSVNGIFDKEVTLIERFEDGIICGVITTRSIHEYEYLVQQEYMLEVPTEVGEEILELSFSKGNVATYDGIKLKYKYTSAQIDAINAELNLTNKAKELLGETDRFKLSPYTDILTELERTALNDLRAVLLSVAKGTIKVMPEIPEFVKKLLEL